jgi:DNA replication protein DnaC
MSTEGKTMLYQSVEKLRTLRLTGMAHALEAQLTQADIARLSFDERLAMLIDREEIDRHNAALAQRLRLARLREAACLEDIDYRKPRGLDRSLLRSLATGQWLSEHNNVLVLGKTGTGKSYIACALGNQAARDGHSVRYQRLSRLLDELAMGRAEGRYASILARLSKVKLLILDDWLMAKLTADQRRDLMEVIDDRHQRGSTVLATQIPLDCWHEQIGDPTYGDAILDRLVHNAYRIELRGPSMRPGRAKLSTDEKSNENKDISGDIPVIHTIHKPTASTARED